MAYDDENDDERFRCVVYPPLENGHSIKILYPVNELSSVFTDLDRALEAGNFRMQVAMDRWDFLNTIAVGGTISLNGPIYPNPSFYRAETMRDVFMLGERTLAHALMRTVFSNVVPYGCSPISFKEVHGCFRFDTKTGFRSATIVLHAVNNPKEDLFRIRIEGNGDNLTMHQFTFEPSIPWLCARYPDRLRIAFSTGEDLGGDSESGGGLGVSTQQEAVVSSKPSVPEVRALKSGGGLGVSTQPEAVVSSKPSVPEVRALESKSEFVSNTGDLFRSAVQVPVSKPKIFKKKRRQIAQPTQFDLRRRAVIGTGSPSHREFIPGSPDLELPRPIFIPGPIHISESD